MKQFNGAAIGEGARRSKAVSGYTAIAFATLYNPDSESDMARAEISRRTVRAATDLGYTVIIADGGSPESLLRDFERYGAALYRRKAKGYGEGKRLSLGKAYDTTRKIIASSEPEKESYIFELWKTVEPILEGKTDIVVPSRKSLDSYPVEQIHAERFGNAFWNVVTGRDLDVWFGPKTWETDVTRYFLGYDGEYGDVWESMYIPMIDAMADGKVFAGVEVDYFHPPEMKKLEENNPAFIIKRLDQLNNLMPAIQDRWNKKMAAKAGKR